MLLFCFPRRIQSEHDYHQPYIKKPLNAFMIFRKEQRPVAVAVLQNTDSASASLNSLLGQRVRFKCFLPSFIKRHLRQHYKNFPPASILHILTSFVLLEKKNVLSVRRQKKLIWIQTEVFQHCVSHIHCRICVRLLISYVVTCVLLCVHSGRPCQKTSRPNTTAKLRWRSRSIICVTLSGQPVTIMYACSHTTRTCSHHYA